MKMNPRVEKNFSVVWYVFEIYFKNVEQFINRQLCQFQNQKPRYIIYMIWQKLPF